ncbi:Disease resistance protein [Corchorus olitorius]|uniref:Disease resistance protein n=1 Tax=Corchorus olitorius TaxID=93759 RepID=A0A1R3KB17_9ROSI|nr:Disease resistance protein [Corchorus olitorius]
MAGRRRQHVKRCGSVGIEVREVAQRCFNWRRKYSLSKKLAKKMVIMKQLVEASKFEQVGHQQAKILGIEFLSSKEFLPSKSSNLASAKIMESLKDDCIKLIGVWGMGGIGKTTLVQEVGKKSKEMDLFDQVVMAVVSQTPNIEKIQDKIADFLDLKFEKKTEEGRAAQLWLRLKKEKRVLVILDDVWNELDLKAIGIPVGADHGGCKILLTTRRQQVCNSMGTQIMIPLDVLDEVEALVLFEMNAGLYNSSPAIIKEVAVEIAKECREDYEIDEEELMRYAWALDLYRGLNSIDEARNETWAALDNLKASCLLIDCRKGFVKMHDMVRDVALWIVSTKEKNSLMMIKSEFGLEEWPKNEHFEPYTAISLMGCKLKVVPDGLVCPNLEILILGGDHSGMTISTSFFQGMKAIKAVTMRSISFPPINVPMFSSTLRALAFKHCDLTDISSLGQLNNLEMLAIDGSDIEGLPNWGIDFMDWNIEATNGEVNNNANASLSELNLLPRLAVLSLRVRSLIFPDGFVFPKLKRFDIAINEYCSDNHPTPRSLTIKEVSLHVFKELFWNIEYICLNKIVGCPNLVPTLDQAGLTKLCSLTLISCEDMLKLLHLVNLPQLKQVLSHINQPDHGNDIVLRLPSLQELRVTNCPQFTAFICQARIKEDWISSSSSSCFPNLTCIAIKRCHSLKCLFPSAAAPNSLEKLAYLSVEEASKLEQVFGDDDDGHNSMIKALPELKTLSLAKLPSLMRFNQVGYRFIFPSLDFLLVKDCVKATTTFLLDSKLRVHAKTEASQSFDIDTKEDYGKFKQIRCPIGGNDIEWSRNSRQILRGPYSHINSADPAADAHSAASPTWFYGPKRGGVNPPSAAMYY